MQSRQIGRLILAGTAEITEEFRKLLPKRLASQVIGSINIPTNASVERIFADAAPVAQQYESDSELQVIDEIVTGAAKGKKAVTGLSDTLNAINQARVWRLVYSDEFCAPGWECTKCAALFAVDRKSCTCGGEIHEVPNIVEHAIEHALRRGANIEVVSRNASAALISAGGIGALLRTRTAVI
jgi:peptide subunit release factor 1 (eRF1)